MKQAHNLQHRLDWMFCLALMLTYGSASRLPQAERNDVFMVADCLLLTAIHIEAI
jgi:hypothetical protein